MPISIITDYHFVRNDHCLQTPPHSPPLSEIKIESGSRRPLALTPPRHRTLTSENLDGSFTPNKDTILEHRFSASSFLSPRLISSSISSSGSCSIKVDVPVIRSGYISKHCQVYSQLWVKRYFWLEKGILTNYKSSYDSKKNSEISSRSKKSVSLKNYILKPDTLNNILVLESTNPNTRLIINLFVKDITEFKLWEVSIKDHISYATRKERKRFWPSVPLYEVNSVGDSSKYATSTERSSSVESSSINEDDY